MLLDLWEWFLLINDGIDLVFSNLASGTYPIPLSFFLVFLLFGLLSLFAWRSTDIPDLPPAPRPPYVIQITAGPGSGANRQTIADVRLLSGGAFFDGSEILTRYQNISRNQATNTDENVQPSTSGAAVNRNVVVGVRNPIVGDAPVVGGQTLRRRIPGRSLLLGLFRRPISLARPVPAVTNAIRAQLGSPNLVVYHRVNVYHHHIHSHLGQNANNPPGNISSTSSPSTPQAPTDSFPSSSSLHQYQSSANSSQLPESSSISETSRLHENEGVSTGSIDNTNGFSHSLNVDNGETTVGVSGSFSAVQNPEGETQPNFCPQAVDSTESNSMPTRSGGDERSGYYGASATHAPEAASTSLPGGDDVRFTIKFLNDTQMDVTSQLSEKIVDFKR